jgi:hypothetical protein
MKKINWMGPADILFDNIPDQLKQLEQFVNWKLDPQPGEKKPKKPPIDPKTGKFASPTDPAQWSDFDTARNTAPNYQGIGFVLTRENGFVMIDIDHCRNPDTGEVEPWARKIIMLLLSYTEISPSGQGIKILIRAEYPKGKPCKFDKLPWDHSPDSSIEIYGGEHYTTLTGNLYYHGLNEIKERQDKLDRLCQELSGAQSDATNGERTGESEEARADLPDEEVLESALKTYGDGFERLLKGPLEGYVKDHSKADFAFCRMLAKFTRDIQQIDRITRRSALSRPEKWDVVHDGTHTYGQMTIEKALIWKHKVEKPILKLTKAAELKGLKDPETEYLWGKVLVVGGSSMLASKPKVGKSTFALNLAIAVSRGEDFLDRPTKKMPVWYLGLGGEAKRSEITRFLEIRGALSDDISIYVGDSIPDLIEQLSELLAACYSPCLVIIDTLGKAADVQDFNSYAEITRVITPFAQLARNTDAHVMMLHHAKKNDVNDIADGILGSTALAAAVDTLLFLDRGKEGYRRLQTRGRTSEDIPETLLSYDRDTCILTEIGEARAYDEAMIERKIVAALRGREKGLRREEILQAVEGRSETIMKIVWRMVEQGKIVCTGKGKSGDPHIFRLKDEQDRAA